MQRRLQDERTLFSQYLCDSDDTDPRYPIQAEPPRIGHHGEDRTHIGQARALCYNVHFRLTRVIQKRFCLGLQGYKRALVVKLRMAFMRTNLQPWEKV